MLRLFDFKCKECNKIFESLVSISGDIPQVECPNCGSLSKKVLGKTNWKWGIKKDSGKNRWV